MKTLLLCLVMTLAGSIALAETPAAPGAVNIAPTDKNLAINLQAGDYYHARLEPLGNGTYRIHLIENRPIRFSVSDWMALPGDACGQVERVFSTTLHAAKSIALKV